MTTIRPIGADSVSHPTSVRWQDVEPKDAVNITLPHDGMEGPLNEFGERCPWPWEPQQLVGVPMGQYHCPYCGSMVMAGVEHFSYEGVEHLGYGLVPTVSGEVAPYE